jgi:spermidine synthase
LRSARLAAACPLLFGSGLAALAYQIAWMRALRIVFGASTAAAAAVLAIFIGGLGAGAVVLGRLADRHRHPLALYARLELAVAAAAAATPWLIDLARAAYIRAGGAAALGIGGATAARLGLAALVLSVPTFLMGGTLPAAARALERDGDQSRGAVAALYGANTLGAVAGATVTTFVLLESLGTRATIWAAAMVNALVGLSAAAVALSVAPPPPPVRAAAIDPAPRFPLVAAALVGFVFFLMELVWYRMLGPILGGTVFTFGLILAVALAGIGLGGACYPLLRRGRPATRAAFALSCLLEAAGLALPFALGDRVALLALFLRPLGGMGFVGLVAGWTVVACLVVLPAAFVAGVQFPLLIALLGQGQRDVGRHVGLATAWNTAGAIAGALAGGFGLLPVLGATGCWRLAAGLLAVLGLAAVRPERGRGSRRVAAPALAGVVALALGATGPTAVWRHTPIGAGRVHASEIGTANDLEDWIRAQRRNIRQELEGVESSIGLDTRNAIAFVVGGKIDGNARGDAGTQVMGGLLGALLHPRPARALVIGLGTGSTAGWLGAVPSMAAVDVVELEPAVLAVARACAPVNRDVLVNPRVHVTIGDARELLLTAPGRYDIIFSEPSNPYRAGIASLFTRETYRAIADRLADGGLFLQWVQAYEVDAATIRTIYATLGTVFPEIETWQLMTGDLLLVASARPVRWDEPALRARIAEEPYRSALAAAWRVTDLEGVVAHFVARAPFARMVAAEARGRLNTDDRTTIEFAFARAVAGGGGFDPDELRAWAHALVLDRPEVAVDWDRVGRARIAAGMTAGTRGPALARTRWLARDLAGARAAWSGTPVDTSELALLAEVTAEAGDTAALAWIERLRAWAPVEADAALARLRLRRGDAAAATDALVAAFDRYHEDPWPLPELMRGALDLAVELAGADALAAARLYAALATPFAIRALDDMRARTEVAIARRFEGSNLCVRALERLEPHVPWQRELLEWRSACYQRAHHPAARSAARDLERFRQGL